MAEPIRKTALPLHRRPPGVRPHSRPRPVPWAPQPAAVLLEEPEPEPLESAQPRTRTFQPVHEKKLRAFLRAALGFHLAALLLPFLVSSASPSPALSDTLLASAVLLAGGAVLAFGAFGRR